MKNIPFGFALVLTIMAATAAALFVFLKANQWILVREEAGRDKKEKPMQH